MDMKEWEQGQAQRQLSGRVHGNRSCGCAMCPLAIGLVASALWRLERSHRHGSAVTEAFGTARWIWRGMDGG
jgi:hypothetical protein